MNYIKYAQDNQKRLGYKIISMTEDLVTVQCAICGAIKTLQLKSLYRNNQDKANIHNLFCSSYFLEKMREEIGAKETEFFYAEFRHSKERCNNPNSKDYPKYKGKFKYKDFTDFYKDLHVPYEEAIKNTYYKELSIDRIDGSLGYEKGNVRFVTMAENLRNKPNVRPVKMTNIITGEVIKAPSFGELAKKYKNISYASALHRSLKHKNLYKKTWKVEYEKT